jgi:hypothetical protein
MINSGIYITATVVLSTHFGIVGLIYANCVNMVIRAIWSLKISLDNQNRKKKTTLFEFFIGVLTHKYFLGLLSLGIIGTVAANFLLKIILKKLNK